ncbi:MAG: site-specific integrase, partial [Lachnospiraceae bacterium]|nr:site-specific integrase [Lachnospiraceae bacterium]
QVRTDKLVCAPEKGHEAYTPEEVRRLREVLEHEDDVYARILRLDFCLVARIGELEALKWHDIDFDANTVLLHAQIVRKKRDGVTTYEYVPHTKAGKFTNTDLGKRKLKLNSKAVEVLKEQRRRNPFGEYVFVSQSGTALMTNKVNEHLRRYCKKAGIRYLSSHSIRVTNITALFDNGVAPTKIQVAAGHSDIRTTNGYCRSEICDEIDLDILEKAL